MTTKYKINCTIDGEMLWGIIGKFLPFEHLHVEEVVERPKPETQALPKAVKLNGAKRTMKRARSSPERPNFTEGVNGVILAVLADGEPHRYFELQTTTHAAGYARSGIGSRLKRLQEMGAVVRVTPGHWRLAPKKDEG